ncbi:MAG: hypothetical protein IPF96_19180 [Rhodobacter sp.]|nr:hypothetical protein [Rhodobacter sp.]
MTTDLAAIQNEKAAAYWANIESDLEAAISVRLGDRLVANPDAGTQVDASAQDKADGNLYATEGAEILVDIREVELASTFERALNIGDAVLVGQVNVNDQSDNSNYDAYELSISLESARVVLAEGETLILATGDTAEAYRRLVDAFADGVVSRLK